RPCWKAVRDLGWAYKNRTGNVYGITKVQLKGGTAGKPQVQVQAKGSSFPMPVPISASEFFDQDPAVIVQLHSSSPAACWSSIFDGSTTKKNDGVEFKANQNGVPTPTPTLPPPRRVFVTSLTYTGNLGGLAGADALCQARADAAALGGTYKAWLADDSGSPATRFTHSTGEYVLVDGTVVAGNWADLTDGSTGHAIDKTEGNGTPPTTGSVCGPPNRRVWSNV